jgi:hypothetical protein
MDNPNFAFIFPAAKDCDGMLTIEAATNKIAKVIGYLIFIVFIVFLILICYVIT